MNMTLPAQSQCMKAGLITMVLIWQSSVAGAFQPSPSIIRQQHSAMAGHCLSHDRIAPSSHQHYFGIVGGGVHSSGSVACRMSSSTPDDDSEVESDRGTHSPSSTKLDIRNLKDQDDFNEFLSQDGRICVIKVYASWCKSCQKFGAQFRQMGATHGDLVESVSNNHDAESKLIRKGAIRMAQIEYGSGLSLCRSLGIKKLPSALIYWRGQKLDGFPCGPKKFPLLVERMDALMAMSDEDLQFEATMQEGDELGHDIFPDIASASRSHSSKNGVNGSPAESTPAPLASSSPPKVEAESGADVQSRNGKETKQLTVLHALKKKFGML